MLKLLFVQFHPDDGPGSFIDFSTEAGLAYEITDLSASTAYPDISNFSGIVMFGGKDSANDNSKKMQNAMELTKKIFELQKPFLGICLGLQVAIKALGGLVVPAQSPEYGFKSIDGLTYQIRLNEAGMADPLFSGLPSTFNVFESHNQSVVLGGHMSLLGIGNHSTNQAIKLGNLAYGIQNHIELKPDIIRLWGQDGNLARIGVDTLLEGYNDSQNQYPEIAKIIYNNFIGIIKDNGG
jgi:GMP synthase (glutamine-hydrolysing)